MPTAIGAAPGSVQTSSASIMELAPPRDVTTQKTRAGNRVLLLVVIILAVGGGGTFLWTRLRDRADEGTTTTSASASATTTASAPASTSEPPIAAPRVLSAKVKVTLPKGAILKVGPNDWTSKVASDGTIELSGLENTAFRLAIYQGKKQLVSQTHVIYGDGVIDPPEIDPGKGELVGTMPPTAIGTKPPATAKSAAPTAATTTTTATSTTSAIGVTGKKPPHIDEKPE